MAQPSLSEQIRRLEAELGVSLFARVGRGLELTEAGRLLRPQAERPLAAAREAAESVQEVRDLTGGTVAFGTFGSAHHYLLGGLIEDFRTRHPNVRVRRSARTPPRWPTRCARAGSRPARDAADRRPRARRPARAARGELYVSAEPSAAARADDDRAPRRRAADPLRRPLGSDDPTRRQLRDRAQRAGVKVEPQIEVEYVTAALELAPAVSATP